LKLTAIVANENVASIATASTSKNYANLFFVNILNGLQHAEKAAGRRV
jgi:hypothetical protein